MLVEPSRKWEMRHARIQTHPSSEALSVSRVSLSKRRSERYFVTSINLLVHATSITLYITTSIHLTLGRKTIGRTAVARLSSTFDPTRALSWILRSTPQSFPCQLFQHLVASEPFAFLLLGHGHTRDHRASCCVPPSQRHRRHCFCSSSSALQP